MKKKDYNPRLQAIFLEIVGNQIRDNDPPETRLTFERLKGLGILPATRKLWVNRKTVTKLKDDPKFQKMMLEGIKWAMGMTQADVTPRPFPRASASQGQR